MSRPHSNELKLPTLALALGVIAAACNGNPQPSPANLEATGDRCFTCHQPDYRNAHPTHVNVKPATCAVCHTQASWHPTVLKHDGWPLTGKHTKAKCLECHNGAPAVFEGTNSACLSCHEKELTRENKKDTWHAHFPTTCETCHQTTGWKPAKSEPGFDLHDAEPAPKPTATTAPIATVKPPLTKPKVTPTPQPVKIPTAAPVPIPPPPDPLSGASRRTRK